ncbi:MAG TPA: hypothetical protein VF759_06505 [Allosphingosinicella sp.]|jgi:hypothetical protein
MNGSAPGGGDSRPAVVVAISGTSGAGKTTIIDGLAARLGEATRLHFDDYLVLGNDVEAIVAWLAEGADPNWVETPELAADLARLAAGHPVARPGGGAELRPAPFIIVEEPFGRARREMAPLIDFAVHLEVPLEIALGRRLLRAIRALPVAEPQVGHAELVADIEGQLNAFLAIGREAYLAADVAARGAADLVLDGLQPPDSLVDRLASELALRSA